MLRLLVNSRDTNQCALKVADSTLTLKPRREIAVSTTTQRCLANDAHFFPLEVGVFVLLVDT